MSFFLEADSRRQIQPTEKTIITETTPSMFRIKMLLQNDELNLIKIATLMNNLNFQESLIYWALLHVTYLLHLYLK
jgi:hypothetical protein